MPERYIVVMAGGSGTRFWPKSRARYPKQFLALGGDRPLLRETVDRVRGMVPPERVLVVTAETHAEHARRVLSELHAENVLVEPEGRNTAACIGWATHVIASRHPDARIAVLPADHFIADPAELERHLEAAFLAAEARIVLFGIVPTHPETGYGYIQRGEPKGSALGIEIDRVARFVEKPDRETALGYLASGRYLWNSGMFVFPAETMVREIEHLLPELHCGLVDLIRSPTEISRIYPKLPSISIDYGVMEKSDATVVLPAAFGWSDVGSWDAAMAIAQSDSEQNVLQGDAFVTETRGTFVDARGGRFVALVGVEDLIVVDTEDALLVIKRGASQSVKHVVDALKARGRKELL